MQDPDRYPGPDDGLRLEDISRRSACDRCRRMKTRCERYHQRDIAQLQQCRRCRQANVRCITTLEAQQHHNDNSDKTNQRNWKRPRSLSLQDPESFGCLSEQQHNTLLDELSASFTADIPTSFVMPAESGSDYGMLSAYGMNQQWHELSEHLDLEGDAALHNLNENQAGAIAVPQDNLMAISSTAENMDSNLTFTQGSTLSSSATVQSIPDTTLFTQSPQASRDTPLRSVTMPSLRLTEPPNRSIMTQLMEFNNKLLHDLQDVTDTSPIQSSTENKSLLVKTLQHSLVFLDLLASINNRNERHEEKPAISETSSRSHRDSNSWNQSLQAEKVDTDLALQLLSCNMHIWSMNKRLYTELTTQEYQRLDQGAELHAFYLHGLHSLDVEMRVQVLVHMCSLALVKIQTELDWIAQRGILTQKAERTFQTVLGVGKDVGGGSERGGTSGFGTGEGRGLGMEQILGNFRRLLIARDLLAV
jgi:hypothetical protein